MIEKLKSSFARLKETFASRQGTFERSIEYWKEKGWTDSYGKGSGLYDEIKRLQEEISIGISQLELGEGGDRVVVKKKLKRFKQALKELHESCKPAWRQWIEAVFIALTLAIVLRHTIFSPYHVPTGSAEKNILVGDRIWGNKMAYYFSDIKRGDLVIFDDPRFVYDTNFLQAFWQRWIGFPIPMLGLKAGPINVVKRAIALPGDTIEGRIVDGKTALFINSKRIVEPYVNKLPLIVLRKDVGLVPLKNVGPFVVPSFLRKQEKTVRYTYDPSIPFEKQPYYNMTQEQVVMKNGGNEPVLYKAGAPTYTIKIGEKEFFSVDSFGPYTLPKDMFWAMGDSRKNSEDSRYWGPLNRSFIRGRASFVLFSLDSEEAFWLFDLLKHPINFWTKNVRWSRTLKMLNRTPPQFIDTTE